MNIVNEINNISEIYNISQPEIDDLLKKYIEKANKSTFMIKLAVLSKLKTPLFKDFLKTLSEKKNISKALVWSLWYADTPNFVYEQKKTAPWKKIYNDLRKKSANKSGYSNTDSLRLANKILLIENQMELIKTVELFLKDSKFKELSKSLNKIHIDLANKWFSFYVDIIMKKPIAQNTLSTLLKFSEAILKTIIYTVKTVYKGVKKGVDIGSSILDNLPIILLVGFGAFVFMKGRK
jgi:hypothetical protein